MNTDLVPCKKCGHSISRTAALCPGCGTSPFMDTGANFLGVAMGFMAWCFIALALTAWLGTAGMAIAVGIPAMAGVGHLLQKKEERRRLREAAAMLPRELPK